MYNVSLHTGKPYRSGAVGALLDEYEKALRELSRLVEPLEKATLTAVADPYTSDEDCRSIQTVLAHVVRSGFCYAMNIRKKQGEHQEYPARVFRDNATEFVADLEGMFHFTEQAFSDYPDLPLETVDPDEKMLLPWGQVYDTEQLLEHAIVHILRHRRQIERFLVKSVISAYKPTLSDSE
jgi:hypothetical protein